MARSRKRVKRKSNVKNYQSPQPVSFSRKRNLQRGTSDSEQVQSKRRRTCRYNLRDSNSVILVSETPCCQTPEQNEKYTRLGLNSALFLKGSQRPKRKQSHISIITISSDDEETSEERTTEWVNSLDKNNLSNVEPDSETINPTENPEKNEQSFQPLCSSTPNKSRSALQNKSEEVISENFRNCASSCTETPVGDLNASQNPDVSLTPSNEHLKGQSCPVDDQVKPEDNFQVVISISDGFTDKLSAMRNQLSDCCVDSNVSASCKTDEQIGKASEGESKSLGRDSRSHSNCVPSFGSTSTSLPSNAPLNTVSSTRFYFGRSTDKNNITSIPEFPEIQIPEFQRMEIPELPRIEIPEFPGTEIPEFPGTEIPEFPGMEIPEFSRMEIPEFPRMEISEFPRMEIPEFPRNQIPEFKFHHSNFTSPMDVSTEDELKSSPATSNSRQGESNQFDVTDSNVMKNIYNQVETKSNTSENPDILLEANSQSKSSS